jgi:hypothetical protein
VKNELGRYLHHSNRFKIRPQNSRLKHFKLVAPDEATEINNLYWRTKRREEQKRIAVASNLRIRRRNQQVENEVRCAEERGMCSQPAAGKMEAPQQYCLRWKYHHSNLQAMFSQLLERECFCDVTLACEGKTLKAHKVSSS